MSSEHIQNIETSIRRQKDNLITENIKLETVERSHGEFLNNLIAAGVVEEFSRQVLVYNYMLDQLKREIKEKIEETNKLIQELEKAKAEAEKELTTTTTAAAQLRELRRP